MPFSWYSNFWQFKFLGCNSDYSVLDRKKLKQTCTNFTWEDKFCTICRIELFSLCTCDSIRQTIGWTRSCRLHRRICSWPVSWWQPGSSMCPEILPSPKSTRTERRSSTRARWQQPRRTFADKSDIRPFFLEFRSIFSTERPRLLRCAAARSCDAWKVRRWLRSCCSGWGSIVYAVFRLQILIK